MEVITKSKNSEQLTELNLPKGPSRLSTFGGFSVGAVLPQPPSAGPAADPQDAAPPWVERGFTNGQPTETLARALADAFAGVQPEGFSQLPLAARHKVAREIGNALGLKPGEVVSCDEALGGGLTLRAGGYQTVLTRGGDGTVRIQPPQPVGGTPPGRDRFAPPSLEQQLTDNLRRLLEHRDLLVEMIQEDVPKPEETGDRILAILTKGIAPKGEHLELGLRTSVIGGDLRVTVTGTGLLKPPSDLLDARIPLVRLLGKESEVLPRNRVGEMAKSKFEVIGTGDKVPPRWSDGLFHRYQIEVVAPARFEHDSGLLLHYGAGISYRTPDLKSREVPVLQVLDPKGSGEVRDYLLKPGDRVLIRDSQQTRGIDIVILSRSGMVSSSIPNVGGRR